MQVSITITTLIGRVVELEFVERAWLVKKLEEGTMNMVLESCGRYVVHSGCIRYCARV